MVLKVKCPNPDCKTPMESLGEITYLDGSRDDQFWCPKCYGFYYGRARIGGFAVLQSPAEAQSISENAEATLEVASEILTEGKTSLVKLAEEIVYDAGRRVQESRGARRWFAGG